MQQLRETFAEAAPYAILDHDAIFNVDVMAFLKATGFKPKRTSIQAPWQTEPPKDGLEAAAVRSSTILSR